MKVLKRNYEHRNLILFLLFSMVYLQAIYSLSHGESIFSLDSFTSFLKNHYMILALNSVTIFMVYNLKKYSDKILLICLGLIVGKNFIMLAASFNKLTLGLNFVYLIFAFYFFVTWELEMAKASYNPLFSERDLEKDTRFHLQGKIVSSTNEDVVDDILITNIDEDGCFVLLKNTEENRLSLTSKNDYRLRVDYEGIEFIQEAKLVTLYDRGIGLEFKKSSVVNHQLNWSDLHKVCLERGLFN